MRKNGVTYRVLKAHPSHLGPGKTHWLKKGAHPDPRWHFTKTGEHWHAVCKGPDALGGYGIHGYEIDGSIPVTCLDCIREVGRS